jgi:hypothetical protein
MSNEPTPLRPTTHQQTIPGPLWDKIKACLIELNSRDIMTTGGKANSPWNQAIIEIARGIPDFRETFLRHGNSVVQQEQHKLADFEKVKQIQARAEQGQMPTDEELAFVQQMILREAEK